MKKIMMGCLAAVAVLIALASCSQDYTTYSGPSHIMFSDTLYQYAVQETNEVFNVPVSATEKVDYDRTFGVEVVDKQSNAIEGQHYRILNNTVTIKAGEMAGNVQVQGIYDNIGKTDSLGFTLKLVIPEKYNWTELYKDYTHVVMQKSCPFDIHNFSGWCMVTSTFYNQYLNNVTNRLIKTEVVEGEEPCVVVGTLFVVYATLYTSPVAPFTVTSNLHVSPAVANPPCTFFVTVTLCTPLYTLLKSRSDFAISPAPLFALTTPLTYILLVALFSASSFALTYT